MRGARQASWGGDLWLARRAVCEPHLGSLDGGASERTVGVIAAKVREFRGQRQGAPCVLADRARRCGTTGTAREKGRSARHRASAVRCAYDWLTCPALQLRTIPTLLAEHLSRAEAAVTRRRASHTRALVTAGASRLPDPAERAGRPFDRDTDPGPISAWRRDRGPAVQLRALSRHRRRAVRALLGVLRRLGRPSRLARPVSGLLSPPEDVLAPGGPQLPVPLRHVRRRPQRHLLQGRAGRLLRRARDAPHHR